MSEIIERLVQNYEGGQISRRDLIVSLSALMMTMAKSSVSAQPSSPAPIKVSTLNHVTLSVSDVGRSVEFYQQVFGMPRQTDQGLEGDWPAATIPILAIGDGPQFIAFTPGGDPRTSTTSVSVWRGSMPNGSKGCSRSTGSKRGSACAKRKSLS